jgi:hypothetical protein
MSLCAPRPPAAAFLDRTSMRPSPRISQVTTDEPLGVQPREPAGRLQGCGRSSPRRRRGRSRPGAARRPARRDGGSSGSRSARRPSGTPGRRSAGWAATPPRSTAARPPTGTSRAPPARGRRVGGPVEQAVVGGDEVVGEGQGDPQDPPTAATAGRRGARAAAPCPRSGGGSCWPTGRCQGRRRAACCARSPAGRTG